MDSDFLIECSAVIAVFICWWYYRWYPLEKCHKSIANGQYSQAMDSAIVAINRWPPSFQAFTYAASASYELQQYEQAIRFCDQAIAMKPRSPLPWRIRALCRIMMCQPGAVEDADQAVLILPVSQQLLTRSLILTAVARYEEALADCNSAISRNSKNPEAFAIRAILYSKLNRCTEAKDDLEKARALVSNNKISATSAVLHAQSVYESLTGDLDNAISTSTKQLRLDESNANAYLNRGWFFTLKRSPDRALENLDLAERYCKSPRTSAFIKSNRARAQTLLGDLQSALKLANEAIELLPLAEFFCTRAVCYFLMGDHEKALTDLKKSITLDPHELEAYWYKAKILRLRGDESHAMELEQKVVGFEHRFLF